MAEVPGPEDDRRHPSPMEEQPPVARSVPAGEPLPAGRRFRDLTEEPDRRIVGGRREGFVVEPRLARSSNASAPRAPAFVSSRAPSSPMISGMVRFGRNAIPPSTTHSPGTVDGQSPPRIRPTFTTTGLGSSGKPGWPLDSDRRNASYSLRRGNRPTISSTALTPSRYRPIWTDRPVTPSLNQTAPRLAERTARPVGSSTTAASARFPPSDGREGAVAARFFLDDELGLDVALETDAEVLEGREREQDGHDLPLGVARAPAVDVSPSHSEGRTTRPGREPRPYGS